MMEDLRKLLTKPSSAMVFSATLNNNQHVARSGPPDRGTEVP